MRKHVQTILRGIGVAGFLVVLMTNPVDAQENRTVDGRELGTSQWQSITLAESEFRDSSKLDPFLILRNSLPDRIQESWRLEQNRQHGPLVVLFYERLHANYFSTEAFDTDFQQVFDSAFASRGVTVADARVEKFGRGGKAAYVSYESTQCLLVMRIFGHAASSSTDFSGDRNLRIFVCHQRDEETLLTDTAIALMAVLEQDGRDLRLPGRETAPFFELVVRLFEVGRTANLRATQSFLLPRA